MSIAYQHTADGYYAGSVEDYGFLPSNATYTKPLEDKEGFVQKWNGKKWEYVENHKGESGYLDGKPFEMKEFGPLPKGFSKEAPAPTEEELVAQARAKRDAMLQDTDKYLLVDFPISAQDLAKVKTYRQELRDITKQEGFPSNITWPKNPMEA